MARTRIPLDQVSGEGSAAELNVGTSANNVVQLNDSAQLPAVDGSLLTNLTKTQVGLGNAENVTLSTWTGSAYLTTVGTVDTGTWHGTSIADSYISSAATWNALVSFPGFGTDGSTACVGNDSRLSDARTPSSHTHPLSALTQSSATTNQIPQWSGSAWVPVDPAAAPTFATGGNIGSAATSATSGTMSVSMSTSIVTITPTGACTFTASGGVTAQLVTFIITTTGTTSRTLTWSTNFKATGTLATGTTSGKTFCITFRCLDGTNWYETGRTGAM